MLTKISFVLFFLFKVGTSDKNADDLNNQITAENYKEFQENCAFRLDNKIAINKKNCINPERHQVVHFNFIEPCKECYLEQLDFKPIIPGNIQAKFVEGNRFQSIIPISVDNYMITCRCQKNVSQTTTDDAIAEVQQEHVNPKCDKVTSNATVKMDPQKAEQCFIDALDKSNGSTKYGEMTMVGSHVVVNVTTVKNYKSKGNVTITYKKVDINAAPKPHCDASRQDEKFCSCLHQSGFFEYLPVYMLNHMLKCGDQDVDKVMPIIGMDLKNLLTCEPDADTFQDEKE